MTIKSLTNVFMDNTPIHGCDGCSTTAGRMTCPHHGVNVLAVAEPVTPVSSDAHLAGLRAEMNCILSAIEALVGDDFCVELGVDSILRPDTLDERTKGLHRRISVVYEIAHAHNTSHSCHSVHGDWRALVAPVAAVPDFDPAEPRGAQSIP